MTQIPTLTKERANRLTELSAESCINFFAINRPENGRTSKAYMGTAGRSTFATATGKTACRGGVANFAGTEAYVVMDDTLYTSDTSGTLTSRGTVSGSARCQFVLGEDQVAILDTASTYGYVYTPSTHTFTTITSGNFLGAVTATYQDTYLVYNPNTGNGRFYVSNSGDFTGYSSLQFATMESYANNLVGLKSTLQNLWLFGEESGEIWYDSGATVPFDLRTPFVPGLLASQTLVADSGFMAWLARSKVEKVAVYAVTPESPYTPVRISTEDIDYRLGTVAASTLQTSYSFWRCEDGHRFYHLVVPSNFHLVYDFITQEWHELQESTNTPHGANCCFNLGGKNIVGCSNSNKLYEMSLSYLDDAGTAINRTIITPTLYFDNKWARLNRFQVDVAAGVGTMSITAPVLGFQYSKDSGHTYSTTENLTLGASAAYKTRAFTTRKGAAKVWNFKLTGSQAVRYLVDSLSVEMIVGGY